MVWLPFPNWWFYCQSERYPAKNEKSLLVNVDIPIDTKRLVGISFYPSKIDLVDMSASENVLYPPNGNFDWEHYDKPQVFLDILCSRKATSVDIPVASS